MALEDVLLRIVAFNRCWKTSQKRWGGDHPLSAALRQRKNDLQAYLLRAFPDRARLEPDESFDGDEPVFGITLDPPVIIAQNTFSNAAHMPVRVAQKLGLYPEGENP